MSIDIKDEIEKLQMRGVEVLDPLNQWICDTCGGAIDSAEVGWFEYRKKYDEDFLQQDFRIVHHDERCMYNQRKQHVSGYGVGDMHLIDYVGSKGLVNLLSYLEYHDLKDPNEIIECIRRLHVPFYEQARTLHPEAEQDGRFDGENEVTRYLPETCVRIIQDYGERVY